MSKINQEIIDEFIFNLKKIKFKGIIQELKLEYCGTTKKNRYLYLATIQIKKSKRNNGYGKQVMLSIIDFSKQYNIKIKLYPNDLLGSDIKRLYDFYLNLGFILDENDDYMIFI